MPANHDLSIFVNSTDSFKECWNPFFRLFQIYWPACPYPLWLNTDKEDFSLDGSSVRCTQIGDVGARGKSGWSECTLAALSKISSKYVLYLQEDYFLNAPVLASTIAHFISLMEERDYTHIRIMELGGNEGYQPHPEHPELWQIPQRGGYRISLQAGLWHRQRFMSYLKPGESAWQLERQGTKRAHHRPDTFFCQNLDLFNRKNRWIFPYTPTGIVRGRWYAPAVVDLFASHEIAVDFSRRGFYEPSRWENRLQQARSLARKYFMKIG